MTSLNPVTEISVWQGTEATIVEVDIAVSAALKLINRGKKSPSKNALITSKNSLKF